jgi:hypothetical protein
MNVFVDFHHASLLNSFILLFDKRFGGNVYRPIGMEWAEKGYWKVYDHPETQAQYLGIGSATPDGTPPLNEVLAYMIKDKPGTPEVYACQDIDSGMFNKALTFDGFMSMQIDLVIATLPQHIEPFKKLCELHPSKPKFIYQIGNHWDVPNDGSIPNIMASIKIVPPTNITYHQEFDTNIFNPYNRKLESVGYLPETIYSFVNVFQNFPDYALFLDIEKLLPDYTLRSYGGQCRDGAANGAKELATRMKEAQFIWHTKAGGDGYGHVLYNSAAVGRPLITKKSYYEGKLGEELMLDGVTCINIDNLSYAEIVEKVRKYSEPEAYKVMCENVYNNFKAVVNFDEEAERIKEFLANLQ